MRPGQIRSLSQDVVVARATRVLALVCLLVHGCANVDGGAVELSWRLRSASGAPADLLDCTSTVEGITFAIQSIRLDWEVASVSGFATFDCSLLHGVTGFDLPQGQALLAVKPICANAVTDTKSYIAPAPELRQVTVGNTISLGAVVIVLQVAKCTLQPCICQ